MKKVAICLRGKCYDNKKNDCNNKLEFVNYQESIFSLFSNLVNVNKDYEFDFYLHGWVSDKKIIDKICNDYKPKKQILEKQIDFYPEFSNIKNYQAILKERYKHLHKNCKIDYNDINFQSYFQNIFSTTYSISKSIDLITKEIDYDFIINLRYDAVLLEKVYLKNFDKNLFYTDFTTEHSHLFHGDFFYLSSSSNMKIFSKIHEFLKNMVYNNENYKNWVSYILKNSKKTAGRYEHGIYSPQMIYSYFINKNNIPFKNIIPKIKISLIKR